MGCYYEEKTNNFFSFITDNKGNITIALSDGKEFNVDNMKDEKGNKGDKGDNYSTSQK